MPANAFLAGLALGVSLILAIGAQNAFVLRQGLRRQHVFAVCLTCALSDALLIGLGVSGMGRLGAEAPWVVPAMRWGGAAFLLAYGARALWSAWQGGNALLPGQAEAAPLWPVLVTCLLLTWANPHVYLDTVVLLGSLAQSYPGQQLAFGLGAVCASFGFFFVLGYGARLLAPVFARPVAWRVLDLGVGLLMWVLAWQVAHG